MRCKQRMGTNPHRAAINIFTTHTCPQWTVCECVDGTPCPSSSGLLVRRSWHKPTPDMEEVARKWMCILSIDFHASLTGRLLKVCDSEAAGVKIVAQVIAGKSPITLAKRASCVKRWIKWGKDAELSIFPLSLNFAMGYVGELCEEERYSAISEAMETFRFLKHVLGFDGCDAVINSPWMKGAVRCRSRKRRAEAIPCARPKKFWHLRSWS